MPAQDYARDKNGIRFDLMGGMNTMLPADLIQQGFPYLQNVRRNLAGRAVARPTLGANLLSSSIDPIVAMILMNDPYLVLPATYALIIGANTGILSLAASTALNPIQLVTGFTGLPPSFVVFRPNASPQPWCYCADGSMAVAILANPLATPPTAAYPLTIYGNPVAGMVKVRSDGTAYKTGIAEPQVPPNVALTIGTGAEWVIYRYVYRSSITGALSNPSPESPALVMALTPTALQMFAGNGNGGSPAPNPKVSLNSGQYEVVSAAPLQVRTIGTSDGGPPAGTLTDYIISTNYGFAIPLDKNITGIQVTINWNGQVAATGLLVNVSLYYQNQQYGLTKSPGIQNTSISSGTDVTQGDGSDSWGAVLTPGVVNDTTFGVGFQIGVLSGSGGNTRSFVNQFTITVYTSSQNSTVNATPSPDPQVDKIDFYRSGPGLLNFTYVGTVPNGTAGLNDTLSDLAVSENPVLEFDNYEPFPSIDLPHSGTCSVTNGITEVTGTGGSGMTPGTYPLAFTGGTGAGGAAGTITVLTATTFSISVASPGSYSAAPTVTAATGGIPPTLTAVVGATGTVLWTGSADGSQFNARWLPGDIVLLGSPGNPAQIAWTLYARPTALTNPVNPATATQMQIYQSIIDPVTGIPTFTYPTTGTGQTYSLSEATLAAQPSPVIWGPTPDNQGSFYFGLDPLNPGDLLWSKGNNFDSAPDTNRQFVTSPSEMLMNGAVTSEMNTVFSTERFWLIYPNFADALATVTGTVGQQWTLIQAQATRGLYMRYALAALGSTIAYRAKDCIAISQGGGPEQSITDSIYNLFPHAGSTPVPVLIAGNTVYPPDDTKPKAQTLTLTPSYLFYNYQDTTGTPRTLVYDLDAKGWSVDVYTPPVNTHLWTVGSPARLLTGCSDGTVRLLGGPGEQNGTAIITTRSENGGDARALKRVGDIFFKGELQFGQPVALQLFQSLFTRTLTGFSPTSLIGFGAGAVDYFTVDFTSGFGSEIDDIGAQLSWALGTSTVLDLWQPDWIELPVNIQDRSSDWTECGIPGNKLIRGMIVEMDTFNVAKLLQVERSDSETIISPNQGAITANGQTLVPFTFTPFTAHMLRLVSTDGVAWRLFGVDARWICDPWPDYTPLFSAWSNLGTDGAKYLRSLEIPMDTNGLPATFVVQTSDGPSVTFTATTQTAVKTPVSFAFVPPIIAHDVQIQCQSNAALWTEEVQWIFDPYPAIIPAYTPIMEVGGSGNKYVRGINVTADSANLPVSFQVLKDGGVIAATFIGTWDGKQTLPFSFYPPIIAHDLQLVPLANLRVFLQESGWTFEPWPEYISYYSAWMNLGREEPKYIRSLTLPLDTNGAASRIAVKTSDGDTVLFTATTTPALKSPVGFAFTPPIIAHEVQIISVDQAAMWPQDAAWEFDPYPEIIPALTPIMEISGPDNKFMQGIKIVGDSSNVPVSFQILYDGGQIGPVLGPVAFNGKQTQVFSFNPPFNAHDVQIVPQGNVRLWMPGMGAEDTSEWVFQPFPESATTWTTEASSLGLFGWCFIYQINLAYVSTTPVALAVTTDQGSFTLTYPPSTGGPNTPSKILLKCPRNKWKTVSFSATSTTAFSLWKDLCEVWVRSWGESAEMHKLNPFGGDSSPAAPI